jgi:hypothetical protein
VLDNKDDVIKTMCKAGTYGKAHEYNGLALAVLLHVAIIYGK